MISITGSEVNAPTQFQALPRLPDESGSRAELKGMRPEPRRAVIHALVNIVIVISYTGISVEGPRAHGH